MDQTTKFSNLLLANLQREYSLQLARLQMQLLQRSMLMGSMLPLLSTPLCYPSFPEVNLPNRMHQTLIPAPTPLLILEKANESKTEAPLVSSKMSDEPVCK